LPLAAWPQQQLVPEKRLSWVAAILPFMEREPLFERLDTTAAWDAENNREILSTSAHWLHCPSKFSRAESRQSNITHFVGIAGVGSDAAALPADDKRAGLFGYDRVFSFDDVTDGTEQTVMLIETGLDNGPWLAAGQPTVRGFDATCEPYATYQFGGFHRGIANAAFADGAVRRLHYRISAKSFEALTTMSAGDKADSNDFY
jgi:Protein of unknown function (DUF1559)